MPKEPFPSRLGKYRIIQELGRGPFSNTYLAEHVGTDSRVALKALNSDQPDFSRVRARFIEEARIQAHLGAKHVGIVQVTDLEEDNDPPYFVMAYCDQGDLAKLVERVGPLPPTHVMRILRQVADALSYVHQLVVLRALKPQSVLLKSPTGTGIEPIIKLIDFGLALQLDEHQAVDAMKIGEGQMLGTAYFAAPEQLRCEVNLDCRCDLFSLGMTAWYLLEGGAPIPGTSGQILTERLSKASYEDALPEELPDNFRKLLVRLLSKDVKARPSSAQEVVRELDDCLANPAHQWTHLTEMEPVTDNRSLTMASRFDFTGESVCSIFGEQRPALLKETGVPVRIHKLNSPDKGTIARFSQQAGRITAVNCPHLPTIKLEFLKEGFVVEEQMLPEAENLLDVIRQTRALPFDSSARLLRYLADACDAVIAAELISFPLSPRSVELSAGGKRWVDVIPLGDFRLMLRADVFALFPSGESFGLIDSPRTATIDPRSDPRGLSLVQRFLRVAYWILVGNELSNATFQPIRGLTEESNLLFRRYLNGATIPADNPCYSLLKQIFQAQGMLIPRGYEGLPDKPDDGPVIQGPMRELIKPQSFPHPVTPSMNQPK